jgi:alpha-beta hydrolase superfamily lysophospholipase
MQVSPIRVQINLNARREMPPSHLSTLPLSTFSRPTQPITFGADNPSKPNQKEKKPGFVARNLAKQIANLYTRPWIIKKVVPNMHHMIEEKHLPLFQPMTSLDFKSLDGVNLNGKWLPSKTPSKETIVLGHGYSADWRKTLELAAKLRESGFNCLMFDFRAHGKSGGDRTSIGFFEGLDVVSACQTARKEFPDQTDRLFYYGHSMGAAAYMMVPESTKPYPDAARWFRENLKGAVLDSGYYSFDEIAKRFIKQLDEVSGGHFGAKYIMKPLLGGKFGDSMLTAMKELIMDYLKVPVNLFQVIPAQILAESPLGKKPTLILHGTQDQVTPFHHGERVAAALKPALSSSDTSSILFQPLEKENHFRTDWKPVSGKKAKAYWTLERGNLSERVTRFVRGVPFAGKLTVISSQKAA